LRELLVDGAQPADERRDAHAAGDPDLPVGAAGVVEASVRPADDGRVPGSTMSINREV